MVQIRKWTDSFTRFDSRSETRSVNKKVLLVMTSVDELMNSEDSDAVSITFDHLKL